MAAASDKSAAAADKALWLATKELGNAKFKARLFDEARALYERAITEIDRLAPPWIGQAQQTALLYSNLSAAHFQLAAFPASIAAAKHAVMLDTDLLKAQLRHALALEAWVEGEPATRRERLEQAILIVYKLRQRVEATPVEKAAPVVTGGTSLAELTSTLRRLRHALTTLHTTLTSPLTFMASLRRGDSTATPATDVRSIMQLVVASGSARQEAYADGLAPLLLQLTLDSASTHRTRAAAACALRHLLGNDIAATTTVVLDIEPVRAAAPALLGLLDSLHTLQTEQQKQVPPPLPAACASLASLLAALITLLARVSAHPKLEFTLTRPICSALAKLHPHSPSHSSAPLPASFWSPSLLRTILASVESVSFIASSPQLPADVLAEVRREWLPQLLLGPAAEVAHEGRVEGAHHLRDSLLGCVSLLTKTGHSRAAASTNSAALNLLHKTFGQAQPKHTPEDDTEAQKKAAEAEGNSIREEALRCFYRPLVSGMTPTPGAAAAVRRLTNHTTTCLIRGLSLLMQANTLLGIFVVSYGVTKEPAASSSAALQAEEQKTDAAPAAPEKPTVLQLLLTLSSYISPAFSSSDDSSPPEDAPPKVLQLLSAEVLALASSDSLIRQTIVDLSRSVDPAGDAELLAEGIQPPSCGRGAHVFLDLILQYTDRSPSAASAVATDAPTSSHEHIVAHAILALAKLIAVGEWGTPEELAATDKTDAQLEAEAKADAEAEGDDSTDSPADALMLSEESAQEFGVLLHILTRMLEKYELAVPRANREADRKAEKDLERRNKKAAAAASSSAQEEEDEDDAESESLFEESSHLQRVSLLHLCFESLSYLALHSFTKKWLICDSNSHSLKLLVRIATGQPPPPPTTTSTVTSSNSSAALGSLSDATMRYALVHVFQSVTTSRASMASAHSDEVSALKQMASRGLHKTGTNAGAVEAQNRRTRALAGSPQLIRGLMVVFAKERGVKALADLFKGYVVQAQENETRIKDASAGSTTAATATSPASVVSASLGNAFAFTLLQLSSVRANRGLLVQQGGVRLLLDLYAASAKPPSPLLTGDTVAQGEGDASINSPNSPYRCSQDCLGALARTLISINPALVGEGSLASCALVLLAGLEVAEHELMVFELLLALTNLASFRPANPGADGAIDMPELLCSGSQKVEVLVDPRARDTADAPKVSVQLNAWSLAKSQLVSENVRVQRAAIELMTNLTNAMWVRTKLRGVPAELDLANGKTVTREAHAASLAAVLASGPTALGQNEDLRLLLVFSLSDDLSTQVAATGALAMLSHPEPDTLLAQRIAATRLVSYVPEETHEETDDGDAAHAVSVADEEVHAPAGTRTVVRTGRSIVRRLLSSPSTSADVRMRVEVLDANIQLALRSNAIARR